MNKLYLALLIILFLFIGACLYYLFNERRPKEQSISLLDEIAIMESSSTTNPESGFCIANFETGNGTVQTNVAFYTGNYRAKRGDVGYWQFSESGDNPITPQVSVEVVPGRVHWIGPEGNTRLGPILSRASVEFLANHSFIELFGNVIIDDYEELIALLKDLERRAAQND